MTKYVFDFAPHITHKLYPLVVSSLKQFHQDDYDLWLTCDGPLQMENLMDEYEIDGQDSLIIILETPAWERDVFARAIAAAYAPRVSSIYFSGWETL